MLYYQLNGGRMLIQEKREIEIIVLMQSIGKIEEVLREYNRVTVVQNYDELKDKLSDFDYTHPRTAIIDINYLTDENMTLPTSIEKELIYKNISLIAYGNSIPVSIKKALYELEFKGIIDDDLQIIKSVLTHVNTTASLTASTCKNNFTKALIESEEIDVGKLKTLLINICSYRNIPNQDIADMQLALISVIIATKNEDFSKIKKMLRTMFKEKYLMKLYKYYLDPTALEEQIIAILLKIYAIEHPSHYFDAIDTKYIEPKLKEEIEKIYNHRVNIVASTEEFYLFCDELISLMDEKISKEDRNNCEDILKSINAIALESLLSRLYFTASIIDIKKDRFELEFSYINSVEEIKKYIDGAELDKRLSIKFVDKYTLSIVFIKRAEEKIKTEYVDDEKISAEDFLKESVVDQYYIDELDEIGQDIKYLISIEDTLSVELVSKILIAFNKYIDVFHATVEFIKLATSLESLSDVLENVSLEAISDVKQEKIYFYIQGLLNDLESWKIHIFIEQNTQDIHYLDASLLENCLEIEKNLLSDDEETEEDGDDDLEFF